MIRAVSFFASVLMPLSVAFWRVSVALTFAELRVIIYSIDGIFYQGYINHMNWNIEYTDEFGMWWSSLSEDEQVSLAASVQLLEERGPALGFPHSSSINGSKYSHMRELRTQHDGRPLRTLHAFDPRRSAILLIGGRQDG